MADIQVEIDINGLQELKGLKKMIDGLRNFFKSSSGEMKKFAKDMWNNLGRDSDKEGKKAGKKASKGFLSEFKKLRSETRAILGTMSYLGGGGILPAAGSLIGGAIAGAIGSVLGAAFGLLGIKIAEVIAEQTKKAFQVFANVQDTLMSYRLQYGDKRGRERYGLSANAPLNRKFTPNEIAQAGIPALAAGFTKNQFKNVINSALIAAKATGGAGYDIKDVANFVQKFSNVKLREGLTREQLAGFGITNADKFFTQLGKDLGMSAERAEILARDAKTLANDSKVADWTIRRLSLSIREMADRITGGSRSGLDSIDTLGDLWNKIVTLPERFFEEIETNSAYGNISSSLKSSLRSFYSALMDPQIIKAIAESLKSIIDAISALAKDPSTISNIGIGIVKLIEILTSGLPKLAKKLAEFIDFASKFNFKINLPKVLDDAVNTGMPENEKIHTFYDTLKRGYDMTWGHVDDAIKQMFGGQKPGASLTTDPNDNLGVSTGPIPYVNDVMKGKAKPITIIHSPQSNITINGNAEPDKVRDAIVQGYRETIKMFEGAVQQMGGQ